jgi:integral membrane protein
VPWSIRWFKVAALAEAVSYLVLLAASVAKRAADAPELVTVMGPIHGVIFLAYLGLALSVREELRWNPWTTLMVVVAAVVPFGGFAVERRLPAWAGAAMPASASGTETESAAVSS